MIRLAACVLTRLGHELPIRTIFEYPILRDLASQIGIVTDRTTVFDVLLPIRTTGSLPPLFCLQPVGGLCWSCRATPSIEAASLLSSLSL